MSNLLKQPLISLKLVLFVGSLSKTAFANHETLGAACDSSCQWTPWSNWNSCSTSCGTGSQSRHRSLCCPSNLENCLVDCGRKDDPIKYSDRRECGGNCINGDPGWHYCSCYEGYSGACCDEDINECWSSPCQNGGACLDRVNRYECNCAQGFYGDLCETGICQPLPADIIFVLDSSASQSPADFQKQLDFVSQFIDHITLGPADLQVALITFSLTARIEFYLGKYEDQVAIKDAITKVKFKAGPTFTNKGLESVKEVLSPDPRPNGKYAKSYVFLLTDGMSTDRKATKTMAAEIRNSVYRVITIGVGQQVSHTELLDIASPSDNNSPQYVFSVDNFNSLHTVIKELVHITCDECETSSASDILFLLDGSSYMRDEDFQTSIDDLTYLIGNLQDYGSSQGPRVGVRMFGTTIQNVVHMDNSLSQIEFTVRLRQIPKPEGTCNGNQCVVNITEAVNDSLFVLKPDSMGRAGARSFVVLVTNGQFNNIVDKIDTGDQNVTLFVIGVGNELNMDHLLSLVADPNHVFVTSFGGEPTVLNAVQAEFRYSVCTSND